MDLSAGKTELLGLLAAKSVFHGSFTLASGVQSDLYIDARLTTLDPRGAQIIGAIGWSIIKSQQGKDRIDAVGGLTLGADPISLAIGLAAVQETPGCPLQVFTVRKAAKTHGRHKLIEGNFRPGDAVVIVDDVITSGGSALQAIDAVENSGGQVKFVLVLVDREEGGRQAIEARNHKVFSIFTRADFPAAAEQVERSG